MPALFQGMLGTGCTLVSADSPETPFIPNYRLFKQVPLGYPSMYRLSRIHDLTAHKSIPDIEDSGAIRHVAKWTLIDCTSPVSHLDCSLRLLLAGGDGALNPSRLFGPLPPPASYNEPRRAPLFALSCGACCGSYFP